MKQAIIFLTTIIVLLSCNSKKEDKTKDAETTVALNDAAVTAPVVDDSAAIRATIIDFYTWYVANQRKLMDYKLYSSLKKNDAAPYKLNWEEAKRYMVYLQDSIPQLGDEFIKNQKEIFAKADSAFKVDVDDDVPVYFDYDWFTNSQEDPSWLLDGIKKSGKWIINVKGDEATVEIGSPGDKNYVQGSLLLFVGMKKENGQWTIAKIGND